MSKFGIKETKEVLDAAIAVGIGVDKSISDDGKVSFIEYTNFVGAALKIPKAISDIGQVPKELSDLDEEEAQEIVDFMVDKLDLNHEPTEEDIERIFEKSMNIFIAVMDLVEELR